MKIPRGVVGLALGLLWSIATYADGQHVLWAVSGKHNTVYLLGSVHLLPGKDRGLPKVVQTAYGKAKSVVEELDLFKADSELGGGAVLALTTLPEGKTLPAVLGTDLYARLKMEATLLHIDAESLVRMQPWYVALMITQTRLTQAGFNSADGVDYQIARRAQRDRKPLRGLETVVEQLQLFANLSLDEQRDFLHGTLDDTDIVKEVTEITAVWRRGDLVELESLLRSGGEESPEFFKALTTDRNLRWLPHIEAMLAAPKKGDYLVVTGALHMVGDMGLVELLRRKGYKVERK